MKPARYPVAADAEAAWRPTAARRSAELRLFFGVVVCVAALFTAGVWWLRQLPVGSAARTPGAVVRVDLVRPSDPVPVPRETSRHAERPSPDRTVAPAAAAMQPAVSELAIPKLPTPRYPDRSFTAPAEPPLLSAAGQAAASDAAAEFQRVLSDHIQRFRHYPDAALEERLEGVTRLLFAVSRNGAVLDIWVETSSGHRVLDAAALETIRRAQPLPVIPSALPDQVNVLIPIAFAMRR